MNIVKHIRTLPESAPHNRQLFYTIDVLDEAISRGRRYAFSTPAWVWTRSPIPAGTTRVMSGGRYYLICNYDKYDNVSHYRVDRISNIRLLDAPAKPPEKVKGLENGLVRDGCGILGCDRGDLDGLRQSE